MGLTIKKSYEENIQVKPFHFIKISLEISSDRVLSSVAEVEDMSTKLNQIAKTAVRKELTKAKEEQGE